MSKKWILMVCWAIFPILVISGCRGISGKQGEEETSAREKLSLMCISTVDQEIMRDALSEFNESNPYEVEIEVEYYGLEAYKTELARRMAVNEEPDLFFSWQSGFLESYVNREKVYRLNDFLEQDEFWEEAFDQEDFGEVTFQGNVYGIPTTKCITVVYYNKALFDQYQVSVPKTYQEFLETCAVFQKAGIVPLYMNSIPWNAGQLFLAILNSVCGKELIQYKNLEEIPWTGESFLKAAQMFQELYQEGYVPEDFLGTEGESMSSGDTAMQLSGNWFALWKDEEYGVFLLPAVNEENDAIAVGGGDRCFAISEKCKNPEAAFGFLKLFSSEKYQSRVLYEESNIPARKLEVDKERMLPMQADCLGYMEQAEQYCSYMDVRFGMEFGDLFNESAQAILSGEDCMEVLETLEKYATEEREETAS